MTPQRVRIVERANERIVGTFEANRNFGFVTPDDKKIGQDIFVPKGAVHGAKSGMKVVVKITKWLYLFCATEVHTREAIDAFLKEVA